MSRVFFETIDRLTPLLERGDLIAVQHGVESQLRALPISPFHIVLDLSISNDPQEAAKHFDRFFARESLRFVPLSAYTEMNGFDINPDRWYSDVFAYGKPAGPVESNESVDLQSMKFSKYQIHGLEQLQAVYASDAFGDERFEDSSYVCSLLVLVKFQRFIELASYGMKLLQFPLYVSAHDFDFIAKVGPHG